MEESIAQSFYDVCMSATNVGVELNKFYSTAFGVNFVTKNITVFNKLVKLYGRKLVFYAIIDMYDIDDINHTNIYPLVSYFCKKRFENQAKDAVFSDLSSSIEKRKKDLAKSKYGKGADILLNAPNDSK